MTYQLFHLPRAALSTGATLKASWKVYLYVTTTTTPAPAYTSSALDPGSVHAQPVQADSGGTLPEIYLDPAVVYKASVYDQSDVFQYTVDPVNDSLLNQSVIGQYLYPQTAAEISAGATPTNYAYPEEYVDRYGNNTSPGVTDMTAAIQTAINVAHAKVSGGAIHFLPTTYRTTATVTYPVTSVRIHLFGNGAVIECDHNASGITWIVNNENYSGHTIEKLTISGPNDFLPTTPGYVPPSNGAGIAMNRGTTSNAVTAYNNVLRDVTIQGFLLGLDMRNVISLNVFGGLFQYNQYGVYIAGGQTNANHFFGTHIRYNRVSGIRSDGATGGSLTNATANIFHACLIESNIAYVEGAFPPGGTPPTDNTAIYLNNSYGFVFEDCYIENHSASVYLTGASKFNQFIRCDIFPGGSNSRLGTIYLDGAGIYSNVFDVSFHAAAATDVHVISNSAAQLYNVFSGSGINFIAGSITASLDYSDVKPDLNYTPAYGVGLIRLPSQGYQTNVSEGTAPGQINGIGTGSGALNAAGLGEIAIGNGITSATTIATVTGLAPNSYVVLRSTQATYDVILSGSAFGLAGGQNTILNNGGQQIVLWVGGDGQPREVGRNFVSSSAYTVTNPSADRALNVSADTTAQVAAVLGTLIADLQARGIIA